MGGGEESEEKSSWSLGSLRKGNESYVQESNEKVILKGDASYKLSPVRVTMLYVYTIEWTFLKRSESVKCALGTNNKCL